MKKLLAFIVLALAAGAFAETETVGGYTWEYRNRGDVVELMSYWGDECCVSPEPEGSVAIPSTLGGKSVVSIGPNAFYNCAALEAVDIPATVMNVKNDAFCGCKALEAIEIPVNVTNIGYNAFGECHSLSSVTLHEGLKKVDQWAFSSCTSLVSVTMPQSLEIIGQGAFWNCTSLESVTFLGDVPAITQEYEGDIFPGGCKVYVRKSYGNWAMIVSAGTWKGAQVAYLPEAEFNIVDGVLVSVVDLNGETNVTIPDGVTSIGNSAFVGCYDLKSVTIPGAVTNIADYAFSNCTGLESVTMEEGVESLGDGVFHGCSSLTSVGFPASVRYVGVGCFDGCPAYSLSLCRAAFGGGSAGADEVVLTITNVVVHFVTTSVQSTSVTPATSSTGIVNIISEISAGSAVAVSSDWATKYGEAFTTKFGSDFTKALTKSTGKRDSAGNEMQVWQDFVAGTDPTDEDDVFTASITFDTVTGDPIISWTPELTEAEAAKRVYRKFGKEKLNDADWTEIGENEEGNYNFFKVSVEMK